MTIYEQEVLDGLSDKLSKNTSVAFQCLVNQDKTSLDDSEVKKTIAGFIEDGRNFDLYHISSILASTGPNKNDDWFLAEEIIAARDTPIYKQVNFGHNEKDIIGVITGTTLLNIEGQPINGTPDELDSVELRDIVSHAVIWSYWEDDDLKGRFAQIVDDIENSRLFVSMESLFKTFDYLLIKDGQTSIIKRSKDTSFLTKYLKIYGGAGEYNGSRIYRLLRNFTFSGMALVDNPANARSIISDNLRPETEVCDPEDSDGCFNSVAENKNCITKSLAEILMDPNEIAMNTMKAELAQAKAELESFKQAEAEKTSAEINELKASNDNLQKQIAELTQVAQASKEDMKKAECEWEDFKKKDKEKSEAELEEAKAKIVVFETEKATAKRLVKLTAANIESAKAEEIMKTWASVSDEHFEKLVEIYAVTPAKTQSDKTDGFDLDSTKATASVVNPNGDPTLQKAVAEEKALAEKIAAQFNFNKKSKGSK